MPHASIMKLCKMHHLHRFPSHLQYTRYSTMQVRPIQCCGNLLPLLAWSYCSTRRRPDTPKPHSKSCEMHYDPIHKASFRLVLSIHPVPHEFLQHVHRRRLCEVQILPLSSSRTPFTFHPEYGMFSIGFILQALNTSSSLSPSSLIRTSFI